MWDMLGVKRQYTEDDKATTLAMLSANGGNVKRTSRDTGIPITTIRQWRDGKGVSSAVADKSTQKKEQLDSLFERVANAYLQHALSKEVIADTSARDAIIAAATATDKMQLLQGKPTNISKSDHSEMTDEQLDRRIKELEARETEAAGTVAVGPAEVRSDGSPL